MISIHSEKEKLWQNRLGHSDINLINKIIPISIGIGLKKIYKLENCTVCLESKPHRSHRPIQSQESKKSTENLDPVHTDLQGAMKFQSNNGANYFITLSDDARGLSLVQFISAKSEDKNSLKEMITELETCAGKCDKRLRSYNRGEFLPNDFQDWLKWKGNIHENSAPYFPESNGKEEHEQKAVLDMARCHMTMISNLLATINLGISCKSSKCGNKSNVYCIRKY